jgi:hypothetical protein
VNEVAKRTLKSLSKYYLFIIYLPLEHISICNRVIDEIKELALIMFGIGTVHYRTTDDGP